MISYFDDKNRFHLETYVLSNVTDYEYYVTMEGYQTYIQEIAGIHSARRKAAIPDLQPIGKTWVISRSRMLVSQYAKWTDDIHITTWAQTPQGLTCPRCVYATRPDGTPLFTCQTKWAIIDMKSGRPLRPVEIDELILTPPKEDQIEFSLPNLKELNDQATETLAVYYPQIKYHDIDYNHHVNNRSYTNWSLDSLPGEFRDEYKLSVIDVHWIKQTYYTDKIKVVARGMSRAELEKDNPCVAFDIYRIDNDGNESLVFDAWSEWKHKAELT